VFHAATLRLEFRLKQSNSSSLPLSFRSIPTDNTVHTMDKNDALHPKRSLRRAAGLLNARGQPVPETIQTIYEGVPLNQSPAGSPSLKRATSLTASIKQKLGQSITRSISIGSGSSGAKGKGRHSRALSDSWPSRPFAPTRAQSAPSRASVDSPNTQQHPPLSAALVASPLSHPLPLSQQKRQQHHNHLRRHYPQRPQEGKAWQTCRCLRSSGKGRR
jgi:hypothetical protein